jgi:hypothetical protein
MLLDAFRPLEQTTIMLTELLQGRLLHDLMKASGLELIAFRAVCSNCLYFVGSRELSACEHRPLVKCRQGKLSARVLPARTNKSRLRYVCMYVRTYACTVYTVIFISICHITLHYIILSYYS